MITLSEIDRLVKNPALVNKTMLDDLRTLSEKYPFSQIFSILYLKGLKNTSDIHFDDELVKHSYRITDRVQLYNLIQGVTPELTEIKIKSEDSIEAPVAATETVTPVEELEQSDETVHEPSEGSLSTHKEVAPESPTEEEETISAQPNDALEENILHHVLTSTYQLDDLTAEEEEELKLRQTDENEEEELEIIEETDEPQEIRNIADDSKHSFTEWLKANNNYEEEDDKDREHIKQIVTNFENFDPSDDLFGEIKKPKVEFFSPIKKAKESLDDTSVPVSETLAKIYALQGNYPKAIEAYEQLSLINPEKKIFFADQIKELKKKIHTK